LCAEILDDGRIELSVREPDGGTKQVELDVRGRAEELTEPAVLFRGLGLRPGPAAVVGSVDEGSPAQQAGLRAGDRVIRGNGAPLEGWTQWVEFLENKPGETVELTVIRDGREVVVAATLDAVTDNGRTIGRIGARPPPLLAEQRYGIVESLPRGIEKTWEVITFSVSMIAHMITGEVSLKNMSGPLSIADIAGSSANAGLAYFLSFLAAVSISLGILNLLPIPLLDGGQIVYQLAEWVKGAPLSERAMVIGQQIGIFFVIALTGFAFYNDIVRLFGS
jgi:regulator of sigma E protease